MFVKHLKGTFLMKDFFEIYDAIIRGIDDTARAEGLFFGQCWAMASSSGQLGMAMAIPGESIAPMFSESGDSFNLKKGAEGIKSWNFKEASMMMAACNAYYNSPDKMRLLNSYEPYENYCTAGLDMTGATVGLIGHLHLPEPYKSAAETVYTIERSPQDGDYPDAACDYILPRCDFVIMTGSTLINKTLPHLLELSRNAYTIMTGPTVPMCPALLDMGIDRLAGLVIDDQKAMGERILSGRSGNPYAHGKSFLLKK